MFKRILILIALLIPFKAYALEEFILAKTGIRHLQPRLAETQLDQVTISILRYAHQYNLDWQVMASIIAQESMFRRDPQHCARHMKTCIDFGIAQINYDTWHEELNLDKKRLLKDIDYNIEAMAKILSKLKEQYGPEGSKRHEKRWHTRYHSFTRTHRKIYADYIYHKYLMLHSHIEGYVKGFGEGQELVGDASWLKKK